tara:strand:- start:137 stop:967 length:831 start_codon:yes stop_codon:yes gene_type:complete
MSDAGTGAVSSFRVGAVISRSFSVFFSNIVGFIPLAVVASLPIVIVGVALPLDEAVLTSGNEEELLAAMGPMMWGLLAVTIVSVATYLWLSAGVTYGVVSYLRGRQAGSVEILCQSVKSVPSLLLLTLMAIAVFLVLAVLNFVPILGTIAFVAIGTWLYAIFWVVVPSIVVEGAGPIAGLGRSAQLTQGHRWSVLGIIILWIAISMMIGITAGAVVGAVGFAAGQGGLGSIVSVIINAIVQAVMMGLGASVAAVGYHDLRVAKEGVGADQIARAFD